MYNIYAMYNMSIMIGVAMYRYIDLMWAQLSPLLPICLHQESICLNEWKTDMLQMPEFDKGRCIGYLEAGKSIRWTELARNVSKSTAERWWNHYRREWHIRRREGSERAWTYPMEDRKKVGGEDEGGQIFSSPAPL